MGFMCGCDGESYKIWTERTHVARKNYQCVECHQQIEPGDIYVRIFSVYYDGAAETIINCERCNDLMAAFEDVGYCWYNGEFLDAYREWLNDCGTPLPSWLTEIHPNWGVAAGGL